VVVVARVQLAVKDPLVSTVVSLAVLYLLLRQAVVVVAKELVVQETTA